MNQHVSPGLWAHSTTAAYENFVIFCVGQDPYRIAAFRSWAADKGIGFKSLVGCYKGQIEQSFIVNEKNLPFVERWTRDEESILHLASNPRGPRIATLRHRDGREEQLGHFVAVIGRDYALKKESWTYDPRTARILCLYLAQPCATPGTGWGVPSSRPTPRIRRPAFRPARATSSGCGS